MNRLSGRAPLRALLLLSLWTLMAAGCSALPFSVELVDANDRSPAARLDLGIEGEINRLVIIGEDGNLYTMDPNGGNRTRLTTDQAGFDYLQPTWSPDGSLLAWAETGRADGSARNFFVTGSAAGEEQTRLEVPFAPFYMYWEPSGDRIAYLSNWLSNNRPSMALRLVELGEEGNSAQTLAEGSPFYFSWSPDGESMLAHIENERLVLQSTSGEQQPLLDSSVGFPAPQWSTSGEAFFFAVEADEARLLVSSSLDGSSVENITRFDGRITFSLNSMDDRLAYVVTEPTVNAPTFGPLYVIDLALRGTQQISDEPALAFFWSPDGEKLAFLTAERGPQGLAFRWNVWDGTQTLHYSLGRPSNTFYNQYLTFFDQYAQSMTIWSPDSRAFVFAGEIDDIGGIWVQTLDRDEPVLVAGGRFAAWSPR